MNIQRININLRGTISILRMRAGWCFGFSLLLICLIFSSCYNDNIDRVIGNEKLDTDLQNNILNKDVNLAHDGVSEIIHNMHLQMGGSEFLKKQKDVTFELTSEEVHTGKKDISIEKYIFQDHYSSGSYYVHHWEVFPEIEESIHQSLSQNDISLSFSDKPIIDNRLNQEVFWTRHTNYFEFTMFFRLLEKQFILKGLGKRKINGISYNLIRVSFNPKIEPENNTIYILYINPRTNIVDQYVYSIPKQGILEPNILVKLEYETVENIKLPVRRTIYYTNRKGASPGKVLSRKTISNVQFNNGFTQSIE